VTSTSRPAALYDHGANNHPVPPPGSTGPVPGRLTEALADLHTVTQRIGTNVERVRFAILTGVVMIAGAVTAYCGAVSFLDIIVPPEAEMQNWKNVQESWRRKAAAGFTVEDALRYFASAARGAKAGAMA